MIDVVVVDDHAVVRRGLTEILREASDIRIVGEADSAAGLRAVLPECAASLVILDLGLPDTHGMGLLEELRRERPDVAVLVLTIEPEGEYAVRAIRSGAAGYLSKRSAPAELISAVRTIAGGERYISRAVAEQLASAIGDPGARAGHELLSSREYEVMVHLARGMSVGEIADRLSLSRQTITTYRTRVLEKLAMKRNSELTAYAIEHRLIL